MGKFFDDTTLAQIDDNFKASQAPQKKKSSGLVGAITDSLIAAPKYFLNTTIANPTKEIAAQVTGNKKAYANAVRKGNTDIGVLDDSGKKNGASVGLKKIAGNTLGLATTVLAPEAKAGVIARAVQGAKIGATAGAGGALANNGDTEDVVKGALEGTATGGVVGGGAGILSRMTKGVSNTAASRAASKAEAAANEEKVAQEAAFKNVPKKVRENSDLQGTLEVMRQFGISPTSGNLKAFANTVTGDNGVVSGTVRQILGDVGQVSHKGVIDDAKDALLREAGQLGNVEEKGTAANGVIRAVRNTIQGSGLKGKGSLNESMDANDAFDTLKKLENRVQELGGTKATGANGAEARVFQQAAKSLQDKISAESDASVKAYHFNPEDEAAIRKTVAKAGGNDDLADHIINSGNNAKSLGELRSVQKPFVNASELSNASESAMGGSLTKSIVDNPGALGDATNVVANVAMGNHYGVAQNASRAAQKSGILDKVIGRAGTVADELQAAGGSARGTFLNQFIGTAGRAEGMAAPQAETEADSPDTTGGQLSQSLASTTTPAEPTEPTIDKGTLLQLIAADPKNAATYMSLFKLFNDSSTASATQQKNLTAAKNAEATLGQIKQSFESAGGGQGKLGGTVANIGGKLGVNSDAATYNDTATALAASLYKALGNTGTISDKDQEMIAKLIPKTTDTTTTAQAKIAQLESLLEQARANSMATQ